MRTHIWMVLGTCWLVALLVAAHGLAAVRAEAERSSLADRAARQLARAELLRLSEASATLRPDSVELPRVVYGIPLRVVVETDTAVGGAMPLELRIVHAARSRLHAHRTTLPILGRVSSGAVSP